MARRRVGRPLRAALAAILVVLLAGGHAHAQVTRDPVSFLRYGEPGAAAPFEVDRLPLVFVDRAVVASRAPENAPASAAAHYREIARIVQAREAEGAPLALTLGGALAPGALELRVTPSAASEVTLVVFEGAYVARLVLAPLALAADETARPRVALDPAWDAPRLGVVALARLEDGRTQSATWLVRDDVPTVQARRAVLVESVLAPGCAPCAPVDDALALLAAQRGVVPAGEAEGGQYLRAPDARLFLGAGLGGLLALVLLRRRAA